MPTEGRIPDISEDDYFFEMLEVEKRLSEDPNTQMSACIVNEDKSVIILGHNHSPNGFSNMPWGKTEENELDTKYPYVIHAELDAITKAIKNGITTAGKKMYILNYPCNECAKAIVQSGIKEIVCLNDNYHNSLFTVAARKILEASGIKVTVINEYVKQEE